LRRKEGSYSKVVIIRYVQISQVLNVSRYFFLAALLPNLESKSVKGNFAIDGRKEKAKHVLLLFDSI
jgi:hypothetical protein